MKITWSCSLDSSGYSSAGRNYAKALFYNDRCSLNYIANTVAKNINYTGLGKEESEFFSKILLDKSEEDSVLIQHSVPDRMILGNDKKILYTVCETNIPDRWAYICNKCDVVMTASKFCKDKMVESGCKEDKIFVVPHTYDISKWNSKVEKLNITNLHKFNFLSILDFTPRKNYEMLISSFIETFSGNHDVSLTIKAYFNSYSLQDQIGVVNKIKRIREKTGVPSQDQPCIFFYGNPISEHLMPRFMQSFDCLVSPHKGEGFGLSMMQMMSLGKPVISTNYSGNLDFMNSKNSYLVDIDGFEDVSEEMAIISPILQGQQLARVNYDSLCCKMKEVYENQSLAKTKGLKAEKDLSSTLSYDKISNQILDIVEAV